MTDSAPADSVDLLSLSVAELKDRARDAGISGFSNMKQAELVAALGGDPAPEVDGKLVKVGYPHDSFDTGISGVPVITAEGVDVPTSKVKQVQALAARYDVPLEVH